MASSGNGGEDGVITRGLRPEDYAAVKEIIARSFGDHVRGNRGALEEYAEETWYDPDHLLVAEVDGRVVSQMGVRDGVLWIEGAGFPAGLVGTVCTLPEYRGQGIGTRMLRAAFGWMEARGLALSYLHTSAARYGFYGRSGYRPTIIQVPHAVIQVRRAREEAGAEGISLRRATLADARGCDELYELYYGVMSGRWSRSGHFWERRLTGRPKLWVDGVPEFWVAEDERLLAYMAVVPGATPRVLELAARPGAGEMAARALVGQTAQGAESEHMDLGVSPHCPLWEALRDCGTEDRTTEAEVLVRMQDVDAFLEIAGPLLTRRAQQAGLSCVLNLRERELPVRMGEGGRMVELDLSAHDLCALVYNGKILDSLLEANDLEIQGGSRGDVEAIFPDTRPARCALDAY